MKNRNKIKKSLSSKIFDVFNVTFLLCFAFITLYPVWRQISVSLSSAVEASKGGFFLYPRDFSLEAYKFVLSSGTLGQGYYNSIFITVVGTVLSIILLAGISYPLTKKTLPGVKIIIGLLVISMIFRGGMIPEYMLIKDLGLINSLWAVILPLLISGFNVFIMRSFFAGIPEELEEAAFIDGATPIQIFFKIILPLSMPVIATIALWQAVRYWNNFMLPLLYLNDRSKYTLTLIVREVINGQKEEGLVEAGVREFALESATAATIMLTMLPVMVIYPFLQKFFVKGITLGAVKG